MPDCPVQNDYDRLIQKLHTELGIPRDYAKTRRNLPKQPDCQELEEVRCGKNDAPILMEPNTAKKWQELSAAAEKAGFVFTVRCGYRSPEEQAKLIADDVVHNGDLNYTLEQFLAPGYSEHHTGRALDILLPEGEWLLPEQYVTADSYAWFFENAEKFGFSLSYPANNEWGIYPEPWHWKCSVEA